jgi:hypothetical protein
LSLNNFSENDDVTGQNRGLGRQYLFSIPVANGCDWVNYLNLNDEWDWYASEHGRPAMMENTITARLRLDGAEFTLDEKVFIELTFEEV